MAISFGGSSLIAQQKLIDYYSLFDPDSKENENRDSYNYPSVNEENFIPLADYDINENNLDENINKKEEEQRNIKVKVQRQKDKNKQKNFKSLFSFGLANLAGYTFKYGVAIIFTRYQQSHMIVKNQTQYNNTESDLYFMIFFNSNNTDIPYNNDTNITSYNYELNKNIFIYINSIYILCILVSVILYSFLTCCFFQSKKKKKKKKNQNVVLVIVVYGIPYEICGCVIYSERVILEKGEKGPRCCKLCCETMSHYCCDAIFAEAVMMKIYVVIAVIVAIIRKNILIKEDNVFAIVTRKKDFVFGLINFLLIIFTKKSLFVYYFALLRD